jgi:hypothetical protein
MPRHTRGKPQGPLVGKDKLADVEAEKRGRQQEAYWKQALDALGISGRIDPERLDEVIAEKEKIEAAAKKKKGGSRRRRRGTRSTRRR